MKKIPWDNKMRLYMKKISLLLASLIILTILLTGCSSDNDDRNLVVGMELAYPPFEMTDTRNNPTGISVDFAQALADYTDRQLVIENMAWTGLLPALETGKIDLIISSMTITEERKERVDF